MIGTLSIEKTQHKILIRMNIKIMITFFHKKNTLEREDHVRRHF